MIKYLSLLLVSFMLAGPAFALTTDQVDILNKRMGDYARKIALGTLIDDIDDAQDLNSTHATSNGTAHANVVLNDTHRASNGVNHANVVVNDTHVAGDGSDHADVATNTTHISSDGTDHSNVVVNDTHVAGDGSDHADVATNTTHISSDGTDHANVVLNDTHRASDGTNHANVVTNDTHVAGDGSDHADVATATAANVVTTNTRKMFTQTAIYDFSVDGGTAGNIASSMTIPDNAIITQVYIDIITAMVSAGNAGTIALSSEGAADLLAAVDADTLAGIVAGIPVGTAATAIKMTAARVVQFLIGVEDLTAGKFHFAVEYFITE